MSNGILYIDINKVNFFVQNLMDLKVQSNLYISAKNVSRKEWKMSGNTNTNISILDCTLHIFDVISFLSLIQKIFIFHILHNHLSHFGASWVDTEWHIRVYPHLTQKRRTSVKNAIHMKTARPICFHFMIIQSLSITKDNTRMYSI